MLLTRRQMLQISLLGGSALVLPEIVGATVRTARGRASGQSYSGGASPAVTPFSVPLPVPPVLSPVSMGTDTDYYEITMQQSLKEIISGLMTTIWGYNGMYPGPTIHAKSGRRIVVKQTNSLPENTSVHLHGGHTPPDSDGHPNDLTPPGGSKDYIYPNSQLPSILWYHDHAVDLTGRHVYMGLSGFYLLHDDFEDSLPLPSGDNDVPLLIQDRKFNSDGSLNYTLSDSTLRQGFLGDRLLVNGAIQPYFQVARRKMRFRILNGSNARTYKLALGTGSSSGGGGSWGGGGSSGGNFIQIGSDGGLLSAPVMRSSISLASAERVDVVIDFSAYPIGTQVFLQNQNESGENLANVMRFDVIRDETDTSAVPSTLRTVTRIAASSATVTRKFTLRQSFVNGRTVWLINGKLYDPARVDAVPRLNATEIWTFENQSGEMHPMHIHDIAWQILDINGQQPSAGDKGWKDVFQVPAWGNLRVIGKFTDNTGKYVFHCHKLEHEDHAMMAQFDVRA